MNKSDEQLMLALIAQLQISMLRYDMEPDMIEKMVDGRRTIVEHKPSAKTIIKNLIHWTVTLIPRNEWDVERVYSNETGLTRRISEILERYRGCFRRFRGSISPIKY